jgi:hypothetical protein
MSRTSLESLIASKSARQRSDVTSDVVFRACITHNGSLTVIKMTHRHKEKKYLVNSLISNSDEASAVVGHRSLDELSFLIFLLSFLKVRLFVTLPL